MEIYAWRKTGVLKITTIKEKISNIEDDYYFE